jgi:hypothetical protein
MSPRELKKDDQAPLQTANLSHIDEDSLEVVVGRALASRKQRLRTQVESFCSSELSTRGLVVPREPFY